MPRGFLSLSMLSRCTHLGIVRAAPPCTSGSANDRRRTRVIAMLRQGIGTSRKISMHALKFSHDVSTPNTIGNISPNSAEQSANIRRCTPRFGDPSPIHRRCSRAARRSIGGATAMLRWALEIFLLIGHQGSHEHYYNPLKVKAWYVVCYCNQVLTI